MPKYIKKKALKNAIECCTWYHINKSGELVEGANSEEHEPLYKYSDIKKIIKGLPTWKFKDEQTEWDARNCMSCKYNAWVSKECNGCNGKHYEPKDKPQTETEIAKAIVHKMIDDAVIAEDAYPDLRQKMHDAVERLDEYYPSEDERSE